jgi:hypothetical protein
MVRGLDEFSRFFEGFEDRFVLIGGAACDLWITKASLHARATKDLDLVLVVEAVDAAFAERFWAFIRAGRYKAAEVANGARHFYRFSKPEDERFPVMLELFSRRPDVIPMMEGSHLVPVPVEGDVSSLSAILLDDDAYRFILEHRSREDGIDLLRPEGLIPLKAKAFVELTARREEGENVDGHDIAKHKNDIARLALILTGEESITLPASLRDAMRVIVELLQSDDFDWRSLARGLGLVAPIKGERVVQLLRNMYHL